MARLDTGVGEPTSRRHPLGEQEEPTDDPSPERDAGTGLSTEADRPSLGEFFVHGVGVDRFNDPSAGSPTETLLRLLLPLGGRV